MVLQGKEGGGDFEIHTDMFYRLSSFDEMDIFGRLEPKLGHIQNNLCIHFSSLPLNMVNFFNKLIKSCYVPLAKMNM